MRKYGVVSILILAVALALAHATPATAQVAPATRPTTRPATRGDVAGLLKPGRYKGALIVPGMSPRCERLNNALTRAMRDNSEWFQAAVRAAVPGEPLAYDARMGITEEEYKNYLAWTTDPDSPDFRLDVGSGFEVDIARGADGVIRFTGGPHLLSTLSIDGTSLIASTPCGETGPATVATTPQRLRTLGDTAPMLRWRRESGSLDAGDYRSADLSVGVVQRDGNLWMEYRGIRQGVLFARNDRLMLLIYINGEPAPKRPE
jgi:hypothetical protein